MRAYHPQTNGQAERFSKTIIARLRYYVVVHLRDCDIYMQTLAYACNA